MFNRLKSMQLLNLDTWFMRFTKFCNQHGNYYLSVKRIPKLSGDTDFKLGRIKNGETDSDVAIVIQGPIMTKDDFTLHTVSMYRKIFSEALLIVSTWDTEDEKAIISLEKMGCRVVRSRLPENMGFANVNAQIKSSIRGIRLAEEDGRKYTLKIRSDWRMYYPYAFGFMKNLFHKDDGIKDGRIVCIDNNNIRTWELPPFFISDFFYFGRTESLLALFDIPYGEFPYRTLTEYMNANNIKQIPSFEEQCAMNMPPEYYICTSYLKSLGEDGDFADSEYFRECMRKYFIMISPCDVDAYWPKYDSMLCQPTSWTFGNDGRNKLVGVCNMGYADYLNITGGAVARRPREE